MSVRTLVSLSLSHAAVAGVGFALGVYALPLLIEPSSPAAEVLATLEARAAYTGRFERTLRGSDLLHWGEGVVSVSPASVSLRGRLAPGPDYKLYLTREPVADADEFLAVKQSAVRLGDVRSFDGFIVAVPPDVDIERYDTVVVWCETFGKFISAARYRH